MARDRYIHVSRRGYTSWQLATLVQKIIAFAAATFAVACIVALAVCSMQPVSGGGFQLLPPGHGLCLVDFNPELLDFAALAGERVVVPVGDATSGYTAIAQCTLLFIQRVKISLQRELEYSSHPVSAQVYVALPLPS